MKTDLISGFVSSAASFLLVALIGRTMKIDEAAAIGLWLICSIVGAFINVMTKMALMAKKKRQRGYEIRTVETWERRTPVK